MSIIVSAKIERQRARRGPRLTALGPLCFTNREIKRNKHERNVYRCPIGCGRTRSAAREHVSFIAE